MLTVPIRRKHVDGDGCHEIIPGLVKNILRFLLEGNQRTFFSIRQIFRWQAYSETSETKSWLSKAIDIFTDSVILEWKMVE